MKQEGLLAVSCISSCDSIALGINVKFFNPNTVKRKKIGWKVGEGGRGGGRWKGRRKQRLGGEWTKFINGEV